MIKGKMHFEMIDINAKKTFTFATYAILKPF